MSDLGRDAYSRSIARLMVPIFGICLGLPTTAGGLDTDELLDRLGETLTVDAFDGRLGVRLSGTVDLESYHFRQPAPALLFTDDKSFYQPRLSLFLDADASPALYVFAHARADRGFDPGSSDAAFRLDEYAVRIRPWADSPVHLQFGKFASVVGSWIKRHGSWENPFVSAPLPYENLTAIWDIEAAPSIDTLLEWAHLPPERTPLPEFADKDLRLPVIWGPSYATGAAVFARFGEIELDAEMKNAALGSRPDSWDATNVQWQHPTFSGRLGYRPNEMWTIGLSASTGTYLTPVARSSLAPGYALDDYRQVVIAHDIGFAWRHLQVWAEFFATRYDIPAVERVDAFSWYLEVKYKLTPQLIGALRCSQQIFGQTADSAGRRFPWSRNAWRIDVAPTYRFTAHLQLKLQYSLLHEDFSSREWNHLVASQLTLRF